MGTSLSGLTPATTFDGLLKTSDNDALDATLKTIGTGDGTDSVLQLSDSALQIGGATTIVGVDNDYNTVGFEIQRSDAQYIFRARNRGAIQMGSGIDWIEFNSNNNGIRLKTSSVERARLTETGLGVGETAPTSRLHIKGSGATSATTSLLVQNSAGDELLKLNDDGNINLGEPGASVYIQAAKNIGKSLKLGNQAHLSAFDTIDFKTWDGTSAYTEVMRITGNTSQLVGIGETTPTARLHVKGSGNTDATSSLIVQNSDGKGTIEAKDNGEVIFGDDGYAAKLSIKRSSAGTIMGSIEGVGNGLYLSGFQGNSNILFGRNSSEGITINNGQTRLAASLGVKGLGSTSATTALLVQNSDGDELMKVTDDAILDVSGTLTIQRSSANFAMRLGNEQRINGFIDASQTNVLYLASAGGGGNNLYITSTGIGINASTPTARLQVKGSGATSATTALLVENSAGTDLLKVTDDGGILMANNAFQIQTSKVVSYRPAIFGGAAKSASAVLQADSTTQGFLPPRMTTTERDAISSPARGLMIYNTSTDTAECWNGSTWMPMF